MESTLDDVSKDGFILRSTVYYGITWVNSFNFLLHSFLIYGFEIGILVLLTKKWLLQMKSDEVYEK